jgi:predicted nucleic acid-binding protein
VIITLDTAILVRATFRSQGPARRLLEEIAKDASHVLALSPYIVGEVGKALSYSRMTELLQITPEEIAAYLTYLRSVARLVEPPGGIPVVLNDPDDDPIVYTAIGAVSRCPLHSRPQFLRSERDRPVPPLRHRCHGRARPSFETHAVTAPFIFDGSPGRCLRTRAVASSLCRAS